MNAIILSVGDELVLGQTVDTNSAWLSRQLASLGVCVLSHHTIADDQAATEEALRRCAAGCDLLLVTGGLGPTADDLTRPALAAVMGVDSVENPQWVEVLEEFFRQRRRPMAPSNRSQALVPRGAEMIHNTCGTAPGLHARLGNCDVYVMPGVPKEMMAMFARDIAPRLAGANGAAICSRTLHTFGLGESSVGEMLGELMQRGRNPSVGTTVAAGLVSLRLTARFDSPARAQTELARTEEACRKALGSLIFGADEETLPAVVMRLLRSRRETISAAESCTGGLLAGMLTETAGSSACFHRSWVTYANAAKQELVGVDPFLLTTFGAVSEPVVKAMAEGARQRAGSHYALAISGVAGPDGGSADKPVGTVCLALASAEGTLTRTFNFPGDRAMIRDRACKMALTLLRYHLLGEPLPF
jgi:nicotinamide-nucleotide amidase